METILNAGLGIGVFMFLVLLFKRGKKRSDYYFLSWILVTIGQIGFYEVTVFQFPLSGIIGVLGFALPLLSTPLLFLYLLALTGHSISWKSVFVHLAIYPIYVITLMVLAEKNGFVLSASNGYFMPPKNAPLWMFYYAVPLAISGTTYFFLNLLLLRKHQKSIVSLFSYDEKINLKWAVYVIYASFVLFVVVSFLIFGATQFQLFPIKNAFALVGICSGIMLIAFGFYGFRQTTIFSNMEPLFLNHDAKASPLEKSSYAKSGLTEAAILQLAKKLTLHMEKEKPFLNEDLNLHLLSQQTQIAPSHLSQIINQHFKKHFYDFVNSYRVAEAKEKICSQAHAHLSLLGIAFECGFKSKSSFNRYFKKYTGSAPSEFRKK